MLHLLLSNAFFYAIEIFIIKVASKIKCFPVNKRQAAHKVSLIVTRYNALILFVTIKVIYPYSLNKVYRVLIKINTKSTPPKKSNPNCYKRNSKNFIINVIGPQYTAYFILQQIIHFLSTNTFFTLTLEKTNVVHYSKGVFFRGYLIKSSRTRRALAIHSQNKLDFKVPVKKLIS